MDSNSFSGISNTKLFQTSGADPTVGRPQRSKFISNELAPRSSTSSKRKTADTRKSSRGDALVPFMRLPFVKLTTNIAASGEQWLRTHLPQAIHFSRTRQSVHGSPVGTQFITAEPVQPMMTASADDCFNVIKGAVCERRKVVMDDELVSLVGSNSEYNTAGYGAVAASADQILSKSDILDIKSSSIVDRAQVCSLFKWLNSQLWAAEFYVDETGTKVIVSVDVDEISVDEARQMIREREKYTRLNVEVKISDMPDDACVRYLMNRQTQCGDVELCCSRKRSKTITTGQTINVDKPYDDGITIRSTLLTGVVVGSSTGEKFGITAAHLFHDKGESCYVLTENGKMSTVGKCMFWEPGTILTSWGPTTADLALIAADQNCEIKNSFRMPNAVYGENVHDQLRLADPPNSNAKVWIQRANGNYSKGRIDRSQYSCRRPDNKHDWLVQNVLRIVCDDVSAHGDAAEFIAKGDCGGIVVGAVDESSTDDVVLDVYGFIVAELDLKENGCFAIANRLKCLLEASCQSSGTLDFHCGKEERNSSASG